MRENILLSLLFTFLLASPLAAQGRDGRVQTIRFPQGATGTTVGGSIRGYDFVDYRLGANAGQHMSVDLETDNTQNYFNVIAPGESDVAFFIGSTEGKSYEGRLPASGDYTIRVYMMRAAARRDEVANYSLSVSITADGAARNTGDALVPGTSYHATGSIPCRFGGDASVTACQFGVERLGGGDARIDVTFPDGFRRTLVFKQRSWSSPDTGEVSAARFGDESEVIVNGSERFTIPDAVMFGG